MSREEIYWHDYPYRCDNSTIYKEVGEMRLDIVGRYIKSFIIQYHLDELDKELEKRGHKFVWYAGD